MKTMLANRSSHRWAPTKWTPRMAEGYEIMAPEASNGKKTLGLSLLSATTVFSCFSSVNPSLFTLSTFSSKPEARERAMPGLWIGLGASIIGSVAIGFAFDEWAPAVVGGLTGVALFGASLWAINRAPIDSIPSIENQ